MDEKKRNVGMQIRIEYFHSLHVLLSNCSTFINPAFTIIFKSRPLCIEKQEFQLFTVTSYNIHYLQNILTMILFGYKNLKRKIFVAVMII